MAQTEEDFQPLSCLHTVRRRKILLRTLSWMLPPEWDDCDAGAAFDEIDELTDEWLDDDEY